VTVSLLLALAACGTAEDGGSGEGAALRPQAAASASASASAAPSASPTSSPTPKPEAQLPRGGRTIFPQYRVVAYYGTASTPALGVLGEGSADAAAAKLAAAAKPFVAAGKRPVLPALELIVTIANDSPGADGSYSTPSSDEDIARYLAAARKAKMLLILDVQPGRAEFLPEVQRYEKWLREPDVGLAIDPEWKMGPGDVPGEKIGSTDAATVNAVSSYLAGLVDRHKLPQKLFLIHQFRASMVRDRDQVQAPKQLATVFHIDGFGDQQIKKEVYAALHVTAPYHNGFKLFLDEDTNMMTPAEAMALTPQPELITYQ